MKAYFNQMTQVKHPTGFLGFSDSGIPCGELTRSSRKEVMATYPSPVADSQSKSPSLVRRRATATVDSPFCKVCRILSCEYLMRLCSASRSNRCYHYPAIAFPMRCSHVRNFSDAMWYLGVRTLAYYCCSSGTRNRSRNRTPPRRWC